MKRAGREIDARQALRDEGNLGDLMATSVFGAYRGRRCFSSLAAGGEAIADASPPAALHGFSRNTISPSLLSASHGLPPSSFKSGPTLYTITRLPSAFSRSGWPSNGSRGTWSRYSGTN